ncbi:MAG: nucleoside deaminase [Tunicatimonas sp.]|uniref:nucleoside deaminase n=1 Tax=Tunicatimonas sp. TaxID=1940096 RepID=UPI003C73B50C
MIGERTHEEYMQQALQLAEQAYQEGEIPVGAIVVANHRIVARAYNQTEQLNDPTAHAEMLALTAAFNYFGAKYLPECSLFVTLEPCVMCAGAIHWSQLGGLVYGASDAKKGYTCYHHDIPHKKTFVTSGVMATACGELLQSFFKRMRR